MSRHAASCRCVCLMVDMVSSAIPHSARDNDNRMTACCTVICMHTFTSCNLISYFDVGCILMQHDTEIHGQGSCTCTKKQLHNEMHADFDCPWTYLQAVWIQLCR